MSVALAQAAAAELRVALLDNGVRRVSIELQPGVARSGWYVSTFRRGLGHHIASRPSQGLNPGLGVVKNGRSDLQGPLCNGYGGYDLIARLITMGWANHPGAGGPWSVPGWGTVPEDNGRPYIFGWEFEGGYEPYTDEMHDFMARCGAGTLDWLGNAPLECWGEHKDPWAPGRKIDRLGYTAASGRARIAAVRGKHVPTPRPSEEDDDMRMLENSKGTVALVTDFAVWVPDGTSARGLKESGVKTAPVSDAFFDQVVKLANRDEADLAAIRQAIEHIDRMLGDHVVRAKGFFDVGAPSSADG